MKTPNTIKAHHYYTSDGTYRVLKKALFWHIPKDLRDLNLKRGDFVIVSSQGKRKRVVISDVFRENIEDTGNRYKPVLSKIDTPENFSLDLLPQDK